MTDFFGSVQSVELIEQSYDLSASQNPTRENVVKHIQRMPELVINSLKTRSLTESVMSLPLKFIWATGLFPVMVFLTTYI